MERLLIVGNPLPFHIGAYFAKAAEALGIEVAICDTQEAFDAPLWVRRFTWHLLGKRPPRMKAFEAKVIEQCKSFRPRWMLATGIVPLSANTLKTMKDLGVQPLNFLTDDPWNPAHQAKWFLATLPEYTHLFSPRRANLENLRRTGARHVTYLPFGYAPHLHYLPTHASDPQGATDVVFVGGADHDRTQFFTEAVFLGLTPKLYGGYWTNVPHLRPFAQGHATADELREITASAINICLVRRANRDGHVMRSFEIPACGGCMLAEDTEEHRAIFGTEGQAVLYFASVAELVAKTNLLLADPHLRHRLAKNGYTHIQTGHHTYKSRLQSILDSSHDT
jgi:spore maturation protein CgeB